MKNPIFKLNLTFTIIFWILNFQITSFNSIIAEANDNLKTLEQEPISFVMGPLEESLDLFFKNPNQHNDLIPVIYNQINSLGYPDRLKEKILKAFDETLLLIKTQSKKSSEYSSYDVTKFLSISFDFIDVAWLLGIEIDETPLKKIDIESYHQKHFASEYTAKSIAQVIENNFNLYNTWLNRILENLSDDSNISNIESFDFVVPELETVYLYLKTCFQLYKQIFITPEFKDFLNKRTKRMNWFSKRTFSLDASDQYTDLESFTERILEEAETFNDLDVTAPLSDARSLSYSKILKMDKLWMILLDSILPCSLGFSAILNCNYNSYVPSYFKMLSFTYKGLFFIPHIGMAPEISFINTLGTPLLHVSDLVFGNCAFDKSITTLEDRRAHDCDHVSSIQKSNLNTSSNYGCPVALENTKELFIQSLYFLESHFNPEDFKYVIRGLIIQHHDFGHANYPTLSKFIENLFEVTPLRRNVPKITDASFASNLQSAWYNLWIDYYTPEFLKKG